MWPNRSFLWIWSHLLKKSLIENFIFCTVLEQLYYHTKFGKYYFKNYTETLRNKCPYLEFFWSVFYSIRTEYGEILRMRENTGQKNLGHGHFSRREKWNRQHFEKNTLFHKRGYSIKMKIMTVWIIGDLRKEVTNVGTSKPHSFGL